MKESNGIIAWFVENSFISKLCTYLLIFGGLFFASQAKVEVFPEFEVDVIKVSIDYPGARPGDVEESILIPIEDEIRSLNSIKDIKSTSFEGRGIVLLELEKGEDKVKAFQDVKAKIDSIDAFPAGIENQIVELLTNKKYVVSIIVSGDQSNVDLYRITNKIKDDLLAIPDLSSVTIRQDLEEEIHIEVPFEQLRKHHITLREIGEKVNQVSKNIPGGFLKGHEREFTLSVQEKRESIKDVGLIPVIRQENGTLLTIGDISEIKKSLDDFDNQAFFNFKPAYRIDVFRSGEEDPSKTVKVVNDYVDAFNASLPESLSLTLWNDQTRPLYERLNILFSNGIQGFVLVLILLSIFLEPRLAFWVAMGIPASILGSFIFLTMFDGFSINLLSSFGFLLTVGVVVDDAIIVGDSIYEKRSEWYSYFDSSVLGVKKVFIPVLVAVFTNILAFMPLFFIPGNYGKFAFQIPLVFVIVLFVSLFDSIVLLPSHLSHETKQRGILYWIGIPNKKMRYLLKSFVNKRLSPFFLKIISFRYFVCFITLCLSILVFALVSLKYIPFSFLPQYAENSVVVSATLSYGSSFDSAKEIEEKIVQAAKRSAVKLGDENYIEGYYSQIGNPIKVEDQSKVAPGNHIIEVEVYLVPQSQRDFNHIEFANAWKSEIGQLPEVNKLKASFLFAFSVKGQEIHFNLTHSDRQVLADAVEEFVQELSSIQGVYSIDYEGSKGKPEFSFRISPIGESLNLTSIDVAGQIRDAFFGYETDSQTIDGTVMKMRLILPEDERSMQETLENFIILTPKGGEIPLNEASEVLSGYSHPIYERENGKKIQKVIAGFDSEQGNLSTVLDDLENRVLMELMNKYPGLNYEKGGEQKVQNEFVEAMRYNFFIAIIAIYILLIIYFQEFYVPLIVLIAIPFAAVGAIIGHLIFGVAISMLSLMGIIALAGIVINDNVVLIGFFIEEMKKGNSSPLECILKGVKSRFRQVMLTSASTTLGLLPLLLDTRYDARFLSPMALSIVSGVLLATLVTLFFVPCLFMIFEDFKNYRRFRK